MSGSVAGDTFREDRGGPIRVMIADDHAVVVNGLELALEYHGFEVVATAENAEAALERCLESEPDVLLLDIHMPHEEGFQVLEALGQRELATKVIMLTASLRAKDRSRARKLGAAGYVSKEIMPDQLGEVIRRTLKGEIETEGVIGSSVQPLASENDTRPAKVSGRLTEQEHEVLRLIASGKNNRDIAEALYVSVNTVKTHVTSILEKLGVENRTQAAIWGIRHGIEPDPNDSHP